MRSGNLTYTEVTQQQFYHNLNFKGMGHLIFLVFARLYVILQIISTCNSNEKKSTSRSGRSDRNVYRAKLGSATIWRSTDNKVLGPGNLS